MRFKWSFILDCLSFFMFIGGHREIINKTQIGDGLWGVELFYPPLIYVTLSIYCCESILSGLSQA
jgi:hypothetical protein